MVYQYFVLPGSKKSGGTFPKVQNLKKNIIWDDLIFQQLDLQNMICAFNIYIGTKDYYMLRNKIKIV